MYEKKIDIILSILSLLHLIFPAVSGTFAVEFMKNKPDGAVLFVTSFVTVNTSLGYSYFYTPVFFEWTNLTHGK